MTRRPAPASCSTAAPADAGSSFRNSTKNAASSAATMATQKVDAIASENASWNACTIAPMKGATNATASGGQPRLFAHQDRRCPSG